MTATEITLALAGIFSLAGAAFNWNWFMEHRKARFFTRLLGSRTRARAFYALLGIVLLFLGLRDALGLDTSTAAALPDKVVVAVDGQSQISVPNDWQELDELNDNAELQAGNRANNTYLIVLTEDTADFENLDQYSQLASSNFIKVLKSPRVEGPTNLTINGRAALQYRIWGWAEGLKVAYLYTNIEGTKNYYQLIIWTTQAEFGEYEPIFQRITESFQDMSE